MNASLRVHQAIQASQATLAPTRPPVGLASGNEAELREAFGDFVGQTLFGQMLQSMRKTVGKPAYFHGGRAEEIFTGQLDQLLAEKISDVCAEKFTGPMYELFMMPRR